MHNIICIMYIYIYTPYGNAVIDETPPERFQRYQNVVNLGYDSNVVMVYRTTTTYNIIMYLFTTIILCSISHAACFFGFSENAIETVTV